MPKLTTLIEIVLLFVFVMLATISSTLYDKTKRQHQTISDLTQQLQQTTQQIEQFKKSQQRLLGLLEQQQQQATKQKQQINEVLQHENNKNWRDQPVPDDISRLLNTEKANN
ncbi:hypothetical protein [Gallibacterium sp. AGMB14963]|uniref:hypothetical protein n=1 Tax=Gallibacterium faecale TaxID=3019086 RepID=UPI0022F1A5E2|nr:hypothetical protein [Gallibacterium sp. AGMB14963]MDA3978555.1 hypothetical protein [Gallibacterium sp. AGMB14963]